MEYYMSYNWQRDNQSGFGYLTATIPSLTINAIEEAAKYIEDKEKVKTVIILSIVPLEETK